jgi:DNA polymerase-3 subunit alpha
VNEFGFLSIEVVKMQKQDYIQDPRYADMKTANKNGPHVKAKDKEKTKKITSR